ncbi:MAG: hypothetical protein H6838_18425 [Planctomycetes bacterium]|nr:hypothetical protein [Planctomycetota bacterium]MCB9887474.1 hypothetical protein [Planctomycetota bacterium]
MSSVLLPILVFTVPVLAIVFLAMGGRRLSGSCGGLSADGSCSRCGKAAGEPVPEASNCRST